MRHLSYKKMKTGRHKIYMPKINLVKFSSKNNPTPCAKTEPKKKKTSGLGSPKKKRLETSGLTVDWLWKVMKLENHTSRKNQAERVSEGR